MRRAVASLVMTMLVAMTSWASACDLSCSLGRAHSVCKLDGAATASTAQAMSRASAGRAQQEMAMDATMVMPEEMAPTQAGTEAPHLRSNSCTNNPCSESSISAISNSATQHPVRALPVTAFARPIIFASFAHVSLIAATQEPPDSQPFDPLSVSRRI